MIAQYYCRVLEVHEDIVLLYIESALDQTQHTERYFKIERFAQIGVEKLCVDFPLRLTITSECDGLGDIDAIFQEADESIFSLPEIDWDFIESRKVEPLVGRRRSD
jgi:hypothetical protein